MSGMKQRNTKAKPELLYSRCRRSRGGLNALICRGRSLNYEAKDVMETKSKHLIYMKA